MLWSLALLPILAGIAVYAANLQRRTTLATTAGLALAGTLALAVWASLAGWRAGLTWNAILQLQAALTPLSATVAILVPTIALPVALFAAAHEHRPGLTRLIALLLMFAGAMELLVIAADLLTLLIGWELVGACSWALIGHRWREVGNPGSGLYAFVTTRFGDLGLFLAAMAAFAGTGSFTYAALGQMDGPLLHVLVFGLVLSAAAKSGQVPFSPWLFRAMAGPTSVSALLHAATMVAAGAYLLARLQPVLDRADWFGPAVMGIGLATALAGGVAALLQAHAKKLLAASTSAHYGLMFVAVGAGYPAVALLHLVAHAAFKALLFLATGVAGERSGNYLLKRMGYGRALPWVAALSAVGALALAGVPPLGGAWTKEAIVSAAGHASPSAAIGVVLAGGLSAAYAVRFQLLAYGLTRTGARAARLRSLAFAGLGLLAFISLLLSLLWLPSVREPLAQLLDASLLTTKTWELTVSLLAVAAGVYAGALLVRRNAALGLHDPAAALADWLGLPWAIDRAIIRPALLLARTAAQFDDRVVDALPRGVARFGQGCAAAGSRFGEAISDGLPEGAALWVGLGGHDTRRLQTGLSHHYYAMVALGAAVLTIILVLWS